MEYNKEIILMSSLVLGTERDEKDRKERKKRGVDENARPGGILFVDDRELVRGLHTSSSLC